MAEIINLTMVRKRVARQQAEQQAAENRVTFGLTREQKAKAGSEREKLLKSLDGAKLEKPAADEKKAAKPKAAKTKATKPDADKPKKPRAAKKQK